MVALDVRRLVRRFGGPKQLHTRLAADGHSVTIKAVNQWVNRNRIPSDWLTVLSVYADQDGEPLHLRDYLLREGPSPRQPSAGDNDMTFLE